MQFKRIIRVLLIGLSTYACELKAQEIAADSLNPDTVKSVSTLPLSKNAVKSKVEYIARDSMRVDMKEEKIYLYGDAEVNYQDSKLKAEYIEMSMRNNIVFAEGKTDSLGNYIGQPEFNDNGQTFKARTMTYNFDTKKGKIQDVMTHEGDGYLHGETVKKDSSDNFYIKGGKYTTCDLPHPHFYIGAGKLKVIKDDKIVTGPANLVIEDIPTPLAVPFGFFPNKKGRANGIKLPEYGDSRTLGFFLKEGGYYFGISDYADMLLTGDIYSKGSYGLQANSNYRKRYKFDGNLVMSYAKVKLGEKGFREFSEQNNFFFRWNHRQDQKARPGSTFMADVNAGSSNYNKYSSSNSLDYLTNQFNSSIKYSNNNETGGYTIGARHDQNTLTKDINVFLPEFSYSLNRIYPVRALMNKTITKNTWYNNIGLSYTANAENTIRTKDSLLLDRSTFNRMKTGARHVIPLSTNIKFLKYFDLTPQMTYNETWYYKTVRNRWVGSSYNAEDSANLYRLVTDTLIEFSRFSTTTFNAGVNTRLYGMYQFKSPTIKAIRHILTPSVGFNYNPGSNKGTYYLTSPYDTVAPKLYTYSIYDSSLYGRPMNVRSGAINFGLNNNLEMKVRSKKDTLGVDKKIMLFDQLNFSGNYDLLADSFQLSYINVFISSRIANKLDLYINGQLDPYSYNYSKKRRDKNNFQLIKDGRIASLQSATVRIGFNFNQTRKENKTDKTRNPDYIDYTIPWNLRMDYIVSYNKTYIPFILLPDKHTDFSQTFNFSGDISLTQKWKIGFNSGYDFVLNKLSYTSLDIYRDLHCWEMRFNWVPFGFQKMYYLTINVKSAVLQDLKLKHEKPRFDQY